VRASRPPCCAARFRGFPFRLVTHGGKHETRASEEAAASNSTVSSRKAAERKDACVRLSWSLCLSLNALGCIGFFIGQCSCYLLYPQCVCPAHFFLRVRPAENPCIRFEHRRFSCEVTSMFRSFLGKSDYAEVD